MTPSGSHRIRSLRDAGRNTELMVVRSVVVVVPVVNQPITGRKAVTLSKANENHAPAIRFRSCQDFMTSMVGVGHSMNPVGCRADRCNGNEGSGADPSYVDDGGKGLFGRCCGRCFHWSLLFKSLLYHLQQKVKKSGQVAFFGGELQA